MFLCYVDESGTPVAGAVTSHYVLAGLAVPVKDWKINEKKIAAIKRRYSLQDAEIHTAWILRPYKEQDKITDFEKLNYAARKYEVEIQRNKKIAALRLDRSKKEKLKSDIKTYEKTAPYIHLTHAERKNFIFEIAKEIGKWGNCRLFAECIDKNHFISAIAGRTIDEQALEQVVSRFDTYLNIYSLAAKSKSEVKKNEIATSAMYYGLLIHDNNPTVSMKHTDLMKRFHHQGTLWGTIKNVVETPMFVDSKLTSMIQLADLCSYSLRRYVENSETLLFDEIFKRADTKNGIVVGVRHFTSNGCTCKICKGHKY